MFYLLQNNTSILKEINLVLMGIVSDLNSFNETIDYPFGESLLLNLT
jgi:hypothetical protein